MRTCQGSLSLIGAALAALLAFGCDESKPAPTAKAEPRAVKQVPSKWEDLAEVCAGKTFPDLPAPDPTAVRRVVALERWEEDGASYALMMDRGMQPELIIPEWRPDDPRDVGLVACADRTKRKVGKTCEFGGTATVRTHDTTDHIRLIDPRDGTLIAEQTSDHAATGGCPTRVYTNDAEVDQGVSLNNDVVMLALPHQPVGTKVPMPSYQQTFTVCGGVPRLGAPAYDPAAKGQKTVSERFTGRPAPLGTALGSGREEPVLVACVTGSLGDELIRSCQYQGATLEYLRGEANIELREAATARVVARETFPVEGDPDCPTVYEFGKDQTVARTLGRIGPEYAAFIAKHGGPAAK